MSLIQVSHLTFCYDGSHDDIFTDVSFQIDTDWKLGFTGRNGRGKTTFLHLLLGRYEYKGSISASVTFDYFPFAVSDPSQNTREVLYAAAGGEFASWELSRELSLLDVSEDVLDRPFSTLSNGEQTKTLLAALFLKENNFLLIDEPTNHLDAEARALVARYLNGKSGFILVSHDRAFLDGCVDHILSINKADIEIQRGNFSSWWENKQNRDNFEAAENIRLKKDIDKLAAAARRTANWSDKVEKSKNAPLASGVSADKGYIGHQAARMMKRSKSIETRRQSALEEKSKLLKNIETSEKLLLKPLSYHSDRLCELQDVSVRYGEKTVCERVSLTIRRGERIALRGKNGSGKSSILKLLCGQEIPHDGGVFMGGGLTVSHVPQDTAFLRGGLREFIDRHALDESLFKAILRKLDFSREQFDKPLEGFSGGQKKKVLIAKSLCERAHLYIWDEPLNFIDVLSRLQIEDLILDTQPTMLFVEHDAAFVRDIATREIQL